MIAFVGAGKVATALGNYFRTKGIDVAGYYSRNFGHARQAAEITNTRPFANLQELINSSRMIWITTRDDAIEEVAIQIAALNIPPSENKMFLHTSGVHSTGILLPIKEKGFSTGSAHPLLSFSGEPTTVEKLNHTWFTIENDELTEFFKKTNNPVIKIDGKQKALYHTACSILANYMVTLMDISFSIFEKTGIEKDKIRNAAIPLLESVIQNTQYKAGKDALTGPLKRGDENTIRMHLQSLEKDMPGLVEIYKTLGRETMKMLDDYRLSEILK